MFFEHLAFSALCQPSSKRGFPVACRWLSIVGNQPSGYPVDVVGRASRPTSSALGLAHRPGSSSSGSSWNVFSTAPLEGEGHAHSL
jgi:hypothetical protein